MRIRIQCLAPVFKSNPIDYTAKFNEYGESLHLLTDVKQLSVTSGARFRSARLK